VPDQSGPQLKLILDDHKKSMKFAISNDGVLRSGIVLSAAQLDQLMAGMAQIRAQMEPEIPIKFPEDAPTHGAIGTHYHFGTDNYSGELVMSLRNPGLGWLSFRLNVSLLERMLRVAQATAKRLGLEAETP
jgi:hypothetical protein